MKKIIIIISLIAILLMIGCELSEEGDVYVSGDHVYVYADITNADNDEEIVLHVSGNDNHAHIQDGIGAADIQVTEITMSGVNNLVNITFYDPLIYPSITKSGVNNRLYFYNMTSGQTIVR